MMNEDNDHEVDDDEDTVFFFPKYRFSHRNMVPRQQLQFPQRWGL